ncbi:Rho GTPase activation protein [Lipomyces kononenkoae]|uniref:Rho GTPase activation protein n=1 Tax=Lipomyces kononenkoae TaxID=34357 RepID=A0ACC3T2T1_LIPKO
MAAVTALSAAQPLRQQPTAADVAARRVSAGTRSNRQSKRYSVAALYVSISAAEQDEVDDELARAQKRLRDLKAKISAQSKKNFVLERDVRYLDSRIALLIQNKIASEEHAEVANRLEETDLRYGNSLDHRKVDTYGNLFFLLQTEPHYIATLCRLISMAEIDSFLQTVMFTIYGNQYEQREEHLLLKMFQSVLASQFEAATEFSSLLRANTPVSRMMTTYTRRGPGQSYLKSVLSEQINDVSSHLDLDLEINPLKVFEQIYEEALLCANGNGDLVCMEKCVSAEDAAANKEVLEIIRPRQSTLLKIANSFLTKIIDSLDSVPYGIRWICKQIRSLTRRKYPNTEDSAVCTLIGAFFFLRFINPAIVTPHSYMLVDSLPADSPRRTLTLVAKMLQGLANKSTYSKEPYMASVSTFVDDNKIRMDKFLNDLCDVPDFYETLELDQYVALSKKDIRLSITINEIYSMHALLEQHLGTLGREKPSRLSVILRDVGPAPALLPRIENFTLQLPLFSRFETQIEDLGAALDITQADVLFMEAKSLLIQIIRSLPTCSVVTARPLDLHGIAHLAASTPKDPLLTKKGIRALELLNELIGQNILQDANFASDTLAEEIEEELAQLGSIREKVLDETRSLEDVLKTIKDHNAYLQSQLETYKSYLRNVRMQSGPKKSTVNDRVGLVTIQGKGRKEPKSQYLGPYKYSQQTLQKEGVISVCNVPQNLVNNLYFYISSPTPGTFVVSLNYKGRIRGLLELNLKLDDLLEMIRNDIEVLDLEYVVVNVPGMLDFLQRQFSRRRW